MAMICSLRKNHNRGLVSYVNNFFSTQDVEKQDVYSKLLVLQVSLKLMLASLNVQVSTFNHMKGIRIS